MTNLRDVARQAQRVGAQVSFPAEHPRRTVEALRLIHAADPKQRRALSLALFRAYWQDHADLTDAAVLDQIGAAFGVTAKDTEAGRAALFKATDEAVSAGVFGVPSFVFEGELWWGGDRIRLLLERLWRGRPRIQLFHDFSSPYSFLASTQIEAVAARHRTHVTWTPILLGALFRNIGTPMVPLQSFNPTRRAYQARDLEDFASWWGVDFKFTSHFPLRTVTALRVAIQRPETTHHLYRAAWTDNVDLGDDKALASVLDDAGFAGAELIRGAGDPVVKQVLRDNTDLAIAKGCCGVPSMLIDGDLLVWGQDRLDVVEAALDGWRPNHP
jgi:2-hydroxychromene-2-carboxylate isomerase